MASIPLQPLSPTAEERGPSRQQPSRLDFSRPSKVIALNPLIRRASDFLSFIALLQQYQIPSISPRLLSRDVISDGHSAVEAIGSIGSGGQYYVDRYYENQRSASVFRFSGRLLFAD